MGSLGIEVIIKHDLEMIRFRFDSRGFKAIHHHLSSSFSILVINSGEKRIDGAEEVRKKLFILAIAGEVRMGRHETVRIDLNPVSRFVFKKEAIIKLFGPGAF